MIALKHIPDEIHFICTSLHRFALKLLDKKRIKAKKGELLAVNERNMLAKVNDACVLYAGRTHTHTHTPADTHIQL